MHCEMVVSDRAHLSVRLLKDNICVSGEGNRSLLAFLVLSVVSWLVKFCSLSLSGLETDISENVGCLLVVSELVSHWLDQCRRWIARSRHGQNVKNISPTVATTLISIRPEQPVQVLWAHAVLS